MLRTQEDFPFCSDRCRTIDLGKWASGGYVISTKINDPEELENIAEAQSRKQSDPDEDEFLQSNSAGVRIRPTRIWAPRINRFLRALYYRITILN